MRSKIAKTLKKIYLGENAKKLKEIKNLWNKTPRPMRNMVMCKLVDNHNAKITQEETKDAEHAA